MLKIIINSLSTPKTRHVQQNNFNFVFDFINQNHNIT